MGKIMGKHRACYPIGSHLHGHLAPECRTVSRSVCGGSSQVVPCEFPNRGAIDVDRLGTSVWELCGIGEPSWSRYAHHLGQPHGCDTLAHFMGSVMVDSAVVCVLVDHHG